MPDCISGIAYRVNAYQVIAISGYCYSLLGLLYFGFLFMIARVFVARGFDRRVIDIGF
jgi:hypothetical protein